MKYKESTPFRVPILDREDQDSGKRFFYPNKFSLYRDNSQDANYPVYVPLYTYSGDYASSGDAFNAISGIYVLEPKNNAADPNDPRVIGSIAPNARELGSAEQFKNGIQEIEKLFKDTHLFYHRSFGTNTSIDFYSYLTAPIFGSPPLETDAYKSWGYSVKMNDNRQQFYKITGINGTDSPNTWILAGDFEGEDNMVTRPRGYLASLDKEKYLSAKRRYDDILSYNSELRRLEDGKFEVDIDNSDGFVTNTLQSDKNLYLVLTRAGQSFTLNNNLDKENQQYIAEGIGSDQYYLNQIFNLKFGDDKYRSLVYGSNRGLFNMYINNGYKNAETDGGRSEGYKFNCMFYSANSSYVVRSRPSYLVNLGRPLSEQRQLKATIDSDQGIQFPVDITDISGGILSSVNFYNVHIYTKQKTSDLFITQQDLSSFNATDGSTNQYRSLGQQININKSFGIMYLYGHLKGQPSLGYPEFGDTGLREEMTFEFVYRCYLKNTRSRQIKFVTRTINSYGASGTTLNLPNGLSFDISGVEDGKYELFIEFAYPTNKQWQAGGLTEPYEYEWNEASTEPLYVFRYPQRLIFS